MSPPNFAIGATVWPGLAKLAEESSELGQVIGKLMAYPKGPHPDGSDLKERLEDELGDLLAAIDYAMVANGVLEPGQPLVPDQPPMLNQHRIALRRKMKLERFLGWHRGERAAS